MSDLNNRIKDVIIESLELEDITPDDIVDSAPIFGKNEKGEGLGVTFSTVKEETKKHFASVDALAAYISEHSKG